MNDVTMLEVGKLVRDVGASRKRAIEDERDWEHLPHVHSSTFSAVELISENSDGWCANVTLNDDSEMEMRVTIDEDGAGYTNATFVDGAENGRAVCRIEETGVASCRMDFTFFIPETSPFPPEAAGEFYADLFGRLVDEDEPKMIYRTEALKAGAKRQKKRREAVLPGGDTVLVPKYCPHQGLPLDCEPDEKGVMTCPWHGYRFDAQTGKCEGGQIAGWPQR